jgi:hypothetical protein
MKEDKDNSHSFVFFLSCQLLTYSWSASYGEDNYIGVARSDADERGGMRYEHRPTYMTTLLVMARTTS